MVHVIEHGTLVPRKGSIMLRVTKRPKRAAQRRKPHALVEVTKIVRQHAFTWTADVTYTYGLTEWTEKVTFTIGRDDHPTGLTPITITDTDYPEDRGMTIYVSPRSEMPQVILDFLIAGRW